MGHGNSSVITVTEKEIQAVNRYFCIMNDNAHKLKSASSQPTGSEKDTTPKNYTHTSKSSQPQKHQSVNLDFETPSDCLLAVMDYANDTNYRKIFDEIVTFIDRRCDFKIAYDVLDFIDKNGKYSINIRNRMAIYFVQMVRQNITEYLCYKAGLLSGKLKFRIMYDGDEKRDNKYLEKFSGIAIKYEKDFIKRHHHTSYDE